MSEEKTTTVEITIENHYSLFIDLEEEFINRVKDEIKQSKALNKYEIAVKFNKEIKTYTFDEFLKLLGFK